MLVNVDLPPLVGALITWQLDLSLTANLQGNTFDAPHDMHC